MAQLTLVIGESGTGKSRSIVNLNSKETALFSVINKPLPFKGWKSKYTKMMPGNIGNWTVQDDSSNIMSILNYINSNRTDINKIVIDDSQYIMTNEFMRRHSVHGKGKDVFTLYNEIADHFWNLIMFAQKMREDINIYFLSHSEEDENGKTKIKTIGKLLDNTVCIEGLFTVVLNTKIDDGKYYFETQNNGRNTTKSPEGMFDNLLIENDLNFVNDKINEYNK